MPAGRPSEYSETICNYILEQIELGRSVKSICDEEDMPNRSTFYRWVDCNEELRNKYARAAEVRADLLFEGMLTIADNTEKDIIVLEDGREIVDHNVVSRDKLRIDTRKWILAKMNPKKYGDSSKVDVTSGGDKITWNEVRTYHKPESE